MVGSDPPINFKQVRRWWYCGEGFWSPHQGSFGPPACLVRLTHTWISTYEDLSQKVLDDLYDESHFSSFPKEAMKWQFHLYTLLKHHSASIDTRTISTAPVAPVCIRTPMSWVVEVDDTVPFVYVALIRIFFLIAPVSCQTILVSSENLKQRSLRPEG